MICNAGEVRGLSGRQTRSLVVCLALLALWPEGGSCWLYADMWTCRACTDLCADLTEGFIRAGIY